MEDEIGWATGLPVSLLAAGRREAEMNLPGRAWLAFEVKPDRSSDRRQSSTLSAFLVLFIGTCCIRFISSCLQGCFVASAALLRGK
jgi:hypothetical protein